MTDYVNEFLDGKMTLAEALAVTKEKTYISSGESPEARERYKEQLDELKTYATIRYMREHGYVFEKDSCKWVKEENDADR